MDCIHCHSKKVRKNGHIRNNKQNYYCANYSCQFVENGQNWFVDAKERLQVDSLLKQKSINYFICDYNLQIKSLQV